MRRSSRLNTIALFTGIVAGAAGLWGQAPPPELTASQQPDTQALSGAVRSLRRAAKPSEEVKAKVDQLMAGVGPGQPGGEVRRKTANAYVLLKGQNWDTKQEYAWSLSLRPDRIVADSSLPFIGRLTQMYPASYPATGSPKVHVSLLKPDHALVRSLGVYEMPGQDLTERPFGVDAKLTGISDGAYLLQAEVLSGDSPIASVVSPIQIVQGIETGHAAVEAKLARVHGHEGAKETVRYPYVLAETVNVGRRQLSPADFGLPYTPQLPYDFAKGVKQSSQLLAALEGGKDPLYRAKGDSERHYWFGDAQEMMAYHVYAPTKWDGKSKLPMVLVLHGNTRDQDYYFDRDDHILAKLAEQHGYLVVCPMGYRPSAGWGSNSLMQVSASGPNRASSGDPMRLRQGELSEKDALNVLDLVTKEYPIDPARIYLFGHSAGGGGSWYMGEKYAEKWAAIGMSAAPTRVEGFPFERLKNIPLIVCHGDQDDEVPVARSRDMVKAAKEHGLDPQYVEVPGATHLTIVAIVEPKVFEFFDGHPHKN